MAENNPNPAPRNVSAINGKQGIDISNVGVYDENTSLDDISGAYTSVGKQLGGIVSQAAEHVGDIQNKLVGNDFGATNPYMYNTYYEPGANEIQSDWRVEGTNKAFEVGMERGKAAAEEAANQAKSNYENAVNDFNQAVTKPTIATVDTSLLGEGNSVSELENSEDFTGTVEHARNANIDSAINQTGVQWDDKSERWSNTVKATMANAGVSQETYDSWSDEQRQSFWNDDANSVFFRNYYTEDWVQKTMGDDALAQYRDVYNSTMNAIDRVYDYLNGVTEELNLEPIKIFEYSAPDIQKTNNWSDLEQFWRGNYHDVNLWTIRYNDLTKEGGWVDQNIREEYRDDVKKFIEDSSREVDYTLNDLDWRIPVGNHKIYDDEALNKLQEFSMDKLKPEVESIYGVKQEGKSEVKELSAEAAIKNTIGVDIDSLKWYKAMREEHPEILDVIKSQLAQAYGETNTIEIADGEKWYLINGEYKQPEAGTVVLFAMPGVMNDDGTYANKDYETFVDCFTKLNNAAANYTEQERADLEKTMQDSWSKYYQSIYMMKIGEAYTGSLMDEDMYRSIMYRVDPSNKDYKSGTVNGQSIDSIVKEWKELADKDGHKAYVQLGQLLNQAYSNLGFYYGLDANGNLVQYNLEIGDTGEKSVGQVMGNDENPYKDYTPAQAMALYNVVTTSLQEYQRGNNQDVNINPYFLDDDNAAGPIEGVNSFLNNFSWMIDVPAGLITMGVGAIGNLFVDDDKKINPADLKGFNVRQALATIWPENWGKDYWGELSGGVSWNEYWTEGPDKGTLDYFVQMSDLQQQNLADAINPYMVEYWFGGENADTSSIKKIGEGYTSRTKPLFDMGPFAVFDVYGLTTMFSNGTAFQESAWKLLGGFAGGYAASTIGTAYKVVALSAASKTATIANKLVENARIATAAHSMRRAIKNTTNEAMAREFGRSTAEQVFTQQASKSAAGASLSLGSGATAGGLSGGVTGEVAAIRNSENAMMRGISGAALDSSGPVVEGFSTEFLEKTFSNAKTGAPMASSSFTSQEAASIIGAERNAAANVGKAIAQETLSKATLALGTGLPAEAFSAMDSATQKLFVKAYNMAANGTEALVTGSATAWNAKDFLAGLGQDGIREAAVKVAEESAAAAVRGMRWTSADTYRVLSTLGWDGASTRALLTDFAKDAVTDMIRDNMRNNSTAYLTNEGWRRQSVEEYFTNPWTYIQNGIFSALHFGGQRIKAQAKQSYLSKKYNEALSAYHAAGDSPDAQAAAMANVNKYINKIQKNNNTLLSRGQPYSKLKNSSDKINEDLNYIITKQYEKSGINPITGDSTERFESSEDFNNYLKDKRMSVNDRINLANRGLVIQTQNNYIMSRYELGGSDPTKLANITNWETNWDMQDIEQKTLDKYYDEVLHGGGTVMERQQKMYRLYTDAIMEKYGKVIPGLEAALNNYYGKYLTDLEARLKKNPNAQWTLGYTSLAGMTTLSDDSGDVMFGAAFRNNFDAVDRNAADVDKSRSYRDLKRQLLDAIKNGDEELTITKADGTEKTYKLNKDGLNYLKTITAYNNSNTVHTFFDPIFGDSVQTHEHMDQKPFAQSAYEHSDAIISGTKIATQAAESDAKRAQEVIKQYTELAYSKYSNTANDKIRAQRNAEIVNANKAVNIDNSEKLYKLSQDRAAAERYVSSLEAQKHGELSRKYHEVLPLISEIDGEMGKIESQREFRQAISNTRTAINLYLNGKLSEDSPRFTYKYGENESVEVIIDDDTMRMISEAAQNGQEFSSDLTISMMMAKRNAVPKRTADALPWTKDEYAATIRDLEADTKKTGISHVGSIVKLREEMKKAPADGTSSYGNGGKSNYVVDYSFKEIKGTDLDTATTGFKIDGKDQLVKNAGNDYYTFSEDSKTDSSNRTKILDAATQPIEDFLLTDSEKSKLSIYDERMISYVKNSAEQNLRNIDTGEDDARITVGKLKKEVMKVAPDAELWTQAEKSGTTERIISLSQRGIQPENMIAELKRISAAHSNMSPEFRSKIVDTVDLYELISENANSIKQNAFSLDQTINEETGSTMGDLLVGSAELSSSSKNYEKYDKVNLERMIRSAGDVLSTISNKNSEYYSPLIKKTSNDLTKSSNIAKAVKKDFKTTAYDYYKKAVANPTPQNAAYVEAAKTWAQARYDADPRTLGQPLKVNEIDCINALGAANHEIMISPYGDKNHHTYSEYLAAVNGTRGFEWENGAMPYSQKTSDFIHLTNSTYGESVVQAQRGAKRLATYFPNKADQAILLGKSQDYELEGNRISAQYATSAQLLAKSSSDEPQDFSQYGIGRMSMNDVTEATRLAHRLQNVMEERNQVAHRTGNTNALTKIYNQVNQTGLDAAYEKLGSVPEQRDMLFENLKNGSPTRYRNRMLIDDIMESRAAKGQERLKNIPRSEIMASMRGNASDTSIVPSTAKVSDYDATITEIRNDLAKYYRSAGLAGGKNGKSGKISSASIDDYSQRLLSSYGTILDENGIGTDHLRIGSLYNDNTDNAFMSVMAQAYDTSAQTVYDAQARILKDRAADLERRISKLPEAEKAGTQTPTEVIVAPGGSAKTQSYADEISGINVLRKKGTNEHFGNPFSTKKYAGVQKVVPSIDEAVRDYEAWLRGTDFQDVEPERRQWIVDQINSGALDGKKLVYYTEDVDGGNYFNSNENPVTKYNAETAPNHAHILAKLVNERGSQNDTVDLLNAQLDETNNAIARHQLLDSEAMIRNGKTQFYTDHQMLSGEFGSSELNIKQAYYGRSNYPDGLEIGEGKVTYTVDPSSDNVDIYVHNKKGTKTDAISSRKLKQYLFDKASEVSTKYGDYYDDFLIDSRDFADNGDGTYTIYGKYGNEGLTLQEQEAKAINEWRNLDMTDIDAEKKAILELSTEPIYHTYDEMVDLKRYKELIESRAALDEEIESNAQAITTINALKKSAYDKYLQLTNEVKKGEADTTEASKKYRAAMDKEYNSFKIDDMDQQTIKSNLTPEEYSEFLEAQKTLFNVAKFQSSSDNGIYHARNGIVFAKDGYNPAGFVDTNIAKAILEGNAAVTGKDVSDDMLQAQLNTKGNRKTRKQMQKEINANQNSGSIRWKSAEEYKAVRESAMDKMSARYTLNNYIEFEHQTNDILTGMGLAEDYKVLMAKDYSDMMQRIAGDNGGIEDRKVIGKFFDLMSSTANLNKTIQDWQLAGGFSNYNAATIAQIRGAILDDPRMAVEYAKVFLAAKNSNATMNYVLQSRDFLYKMVARTGNGSLVTDLNAAISAQPGQEDLGTINSLVSRAYGHFSGEREIEGKNKISRGFGRLSDDMNAIFSDATFRNTLPLFKLRMLQINYDEALRYLQGFKGFEKYSAHDVEDACMWMAYAKTMDFIEPRKTRGQTFEEFTNRIANDELKKSAASWTGAKRDASLMDDASSVFFALRWKMTFGGRVLNGLTGTPGQLIRAAKLHNADISDTNNLQMAQTQFMRRGNVLGVGTMLALSSLAMIWNHSLGYDSISWDDLNPIGEDGEFQVPNILKKIQTLGQFWLPNTVDENGNWRIDPTQKAPVIDTFSSIFTIPNVIATTFDKLVNPNAYETNMQRGLLGSESSSDAVNGFINSPFVKAIGDELIGANLLSPYKAMYEVLVDDTYFGNNIWEKKKLADGSTNPNYDPFRNVVAGFAHILNFDWLLSDGTNKWVKGFGTSKYQTTGKVGTVAGSGIFQHEFVTAAISIMNGDSLEGIIEAGELPIKMKRISGTARTDFNIRVKNIVTQYVQEYKDKVGNLYNVDAKDAAYAELCQKCADVVAQWSAKNKYVLGQDQELVAYVTKTLMAICAGEYNDNLNYVQNAYWKASEIAQIESSEELFLKDSDLERYIAEGKTAEEFAQEKNRRSEAYNQAVDDEYQARIALKAAGLPDEYLAAYEDVYGSTSKTDFKSEMRAVNRQVYAEVHGVLESPIGEFDNFSEMKAYYEAQIEAASTTKQKAKLANKYNDILKDAISPYIYKYGAAILSDGYYNNQNLANSIADYVIIPADEYYYGKTPRASYLRDQFGVGYRNKTNLPSDKEVYEKYTGALKKVHEGASATAASMLDRLIKDYKNGRTYISDSDYSKIVRMKSQLNARSK